MPGKIVRVRILKATQKGKKFQAQFFDADGKKVKTTAFGAAGMSDYTQHKDVDRKKRYDARHKSSE